MRTYAAEIKILAWGEKRTYSIAAKNFTEAWKKLKGLMYRQWRGRSYRILSIVQTAVLDA